MVNIEKRGNVELVSFTVNRINALITEELREPVMKLFEQQNTRVVFDLKGVEYIDSSGIGIFLSAFREARSNYGSMKICCPEPAVKLLFETLHLHTIFEIYGSTDDCIRSFR